MSTNEHKTLVNWREWSDDTFREAQAGDKPILLDIGAVWCHWCHVMDDGIPGDPVHTGTYSNLEIASFINENFVPIKVDNDKRPDINARYNMGGWPTTAFLTPRGEPLYGETYIHPQRMTQLMHQIAKYYQDNKTEIAERIAEHLADERETKTPEIDLAEVARMEFSWIDRVLVSTFDAEFGGFGTQPKFPHSDALEYALMRSVKTGESKLTDVYKETLEAMASGGMYDQFAGGFFRYSTTRDWSIPHYEKMLEDNARLSRVAFLGARLLGDDKLAEIGRDVHNWLLTTMFDSEKCAFYGSQDADKEEEYYGRPLSEREHLTTPYIDKTIYLNWNAMIVSSLCERYRHDGDPKFLDIASRCYGFLKSGIWPKHYLDFRGFDSSSAGGPEYLLSDLIELGLAALNLAETVGGAGFVADAREIGQHILDNLDDKTYGGYFDSCPDPDALGALSSPVKDLASSSACASFLLRLGILEEDQQYTESATRALRYCLLSARQSGLFASSFGLALRDLDILGKVVIVGGLGSDAVKELQYVIWSAERGTIFLVEALSPGDSKEFPMRNGAKACAYVCADRRCNVFDSPGDLKNEILRMSQITSVRH